MARCSITGTCFLRLLSSSINTGIQPSRHGEIHLHRAALPDPAQAVLQGVFDLGTVERALTRLQFPVHALVRSAPLASAARPCPRPRRLPTRFSGRVDRRSMITSLKPKSA